MCTVCVCGVAERSRCRSLVCVEVVFETEEQNRTYLRVPRVWEGHDCLWRAAVNTQHVYTRTSVQMQCIGSNVKVGTAKTSNACICSQNVKIPLDSKEVWQASVMYVTSNRASRCVVVSSPWPCFGANGGITERAFGWLCANCRVVVEK